MGRESRAGKKCARTPRPPSVEPFELMRPLLPDKASARLDALFDRLTGLKERFVGYPVTADLDYRELNRFLDFPLNNVGDPFKDGTYGLHTHEFEREVVHWFAELLHAPPEQTWGYVTNGGTEGNLYGLYLARELYPDGMVYASQDTHYSVAKNLRLLKMPHLMIRSREDGSIDEDDLRESMRIHRDVPPIVFANIGTTMKEGIDRVDRIRNILADLAIPRSYLHCDAALAGMTLPFQDRAPRFDFAEGIDSIAISGHKFIGSPVPCGIVLAKQEHVRRIARSIEYVGTLDTTIPGSRNGFTPLVLWHAIQHWGREGFAQRVHHCLGHAVYAVHRLRSVGVPAWRNPHAITVVFPRPSAEVLGRWQIAVQGNIGHLLVMPQITRAQIDALATDLARDRAPLSGERMVSVAESS